ncbi:hypothetical protein EK21DRAFT_106299 [Setomelanomma holmii]|uniref:Uncharacterized protein n=1 Tax=Setomelanomma holmii TaxID=210430 RepID=A0A9P4LQH7_9PLEO|nr:hypothetical protein EK21DRAFT_106299 [Setomelanomma holmii]
MTSLVAVRTALKATDSEHAALFTSLLDNGKLVPYKSKDSVRRKLGLTEADYPSLGKKQAPVVVRNPPSLEELRDICARDFPEAREYFGGRLIYLTKSGSASEIDATEETAGMWTINNLTNADAAPNSSIVTFPSEGLDELCDQGYVPPENVIHEAMTTSLILPRSTLLPLHHSNEGTTVTTVLSGSVIWTIWPSTNRNLRFLQTAYENYAETWDESRLDIAGHLEGGMAFVQTERDGLRIPPFCIMLCLSTTTSVLATYSHVTIKEFLSMLQKLPFLRAWFPTEVDGTRKQADFNASFLRYLDLMLNDDAEEEDEDKSKLKLPEGPLLKQLLNTWDKVKDDLAAMMGPAHCEATKNIWEAYLISAKGRQCRICNKRIDNKQKLMRKHFVEKHWVTAKVSKRVDSMEAMGGEDFAENMVEENEEGIMEVVEGVEDMELDEC